MDTPPIVKQPFLKTWLTNLLSINETRVSTLVFAFFIMLGTQMPKLVKGQDISSETSKVLIALIIAISGVNAIASAFGMQGGMYGGYSSYGGYGGYNNYSQPIQQSNYSQSVNSSQSTVNEDIQ